MPTHLMLKGSNLCVLDELYNPSEAGLDDLVKAGTSTVEISYIALTSELVESVVKHNLRIVVQASPQNDCDIEAPLALAQKIKAVALNLHVRTPHLTHSKSVELTKSLIQRVGDAGIPLTFETHRGTITQDLFRTAQLVDAVPEMRFTLDVSHYIVCEEVPGPVAKMASLLDGILDRTEMIHGRISNGQQIQQHTIDPNAPLSQGYLALWTEAMRRWRLRKPAGSSIIFTPEPGPPSYAITNPDGSQLLNRLEQSEVIWDLATKAWKASAVAGKTPVWPPKV